MSLQDIKQTLSKILTLNKNLDENRLNNLLEAGGWEKKNKEEALSIFKYLKINSNIQKQEDDKSLSTEVVNQELSVADNTSVSATISKVEEIKPVSFDSKTEIENFIPSNLPIKDIGSQDLISKDYSASSVVKNINITPENITEKKSKRVNLVVLFSVILIILLFSFGYMYKAGIIQ